MTDAVLAVNNLDVRFATPDGEVPAEGKLNSTTVLGALGGLSALFGKGNA